MTDGLVEALVELAKAPSAVRLGRETLMSPDDPVLREYVEEALLPRFEKIDGERIVRFKEHQFAFVVGDGLGPTLMLMAYTPTQHHNLMARPWSGLIERRDSEEIILGQGITQNKAHQACLVALARWLTTEQVSIGGTLYLCVNNEGRSTHDCSMAIFEDLEPRPDLVVELFPTGFDVSIGNRGRVDIEVDVFAEAAHSSAPPDDRVIEMCAEIVQRVRSLDEHLRSAPVSPVGAERCVPYQLWFDPLAPHTLPSHGHLTLDRRLVIGGTDAEGAVEEVKALLDGVTNWGCGVEVSGGVAMLPVLMSETNLVAIRPLDVAIEKTRGVSARHVIYPGTFDAGGPSALGIPTVMFGVPDKGPLLGDDFVTVSDLKEEYAVLQALVREVFDVGT